MISLIALALIGAVVGIAALATAQPQMTGRF